MGEFLALLLTDECVKMGFYGECLKFSAMMLLTGETRFARARFQFNLKSNIAHKKADKQTSF